MAIFRIKISTTTKAGNLPVVFEDTEYLMEGNADTVDTLKRLAEAEGFTMKATGVSTLLPETIISRFKEGLEEFAGPDAPRW